jgi:hypothetical protein
MNYWKDLSQWLYCEENKTFNRWHTRDAIEKYKKHSEDTELL